jgi:uncharacterized protein
MQASRFNILSQVKDSEGYIIVNLLSGQADLITSEEAASLGNPSGEFADLCRQRGYLVEPAEEERRFNLAYIDFLDKRDEEEVQVFFVPTYACNFECTYCYQSEYPCKAEVLRPDIIDGFFDFLTGHLANRSKYITLFGGEPLLPGKAYMQTLGNFISRCGAEGIDLAIVTNGYHLDAYLPLLKQANIREIQLTLDGTGEVHDHRRPHKGGTSSFDRISANLEASLEAGYTVNLRVVVDRENINNLPELARYAIARGWTKHPHFKTQLGRNYELHYCQSGQQKLYSRLELYQDLYRLIRQHPELLTFHKPAFSVSGFLFENGSLPPPLFDACPACKAEWALDYTGKIFGCTATVGKPGEELGIFSPVVSLDGKAVKSWQHRDITTIDACRHCQLQLACGGGCGSLAKNMHGTLLSPDCRPIKELIGLGSGLFSGS